MEMKTMTVKKNKDAKNGVDIDYSLPEKDDWEELKAITGVEDAFGFIVALYEKRLQARDQIPLPMRKASGGQKLFSLCEGYHHER